jgi:thiol-disulfide isomerase/thioredoxin
VEPLPRRGGLLTIAALGAIGLAVAIWVFLGPDEADPTPSTVAPAGALEVGSPAPAFTVRRLDAGTFSLATHLADDGRPVVLNFWASWCTPCRAEMPALDEAAAANPDVLFLGVATSDTEAAARRFADEVSVGYPLAIDTTGVVANDFGAFGLPTTYAIAADGTIARIALGEIGAQDIADLIAAATR